MFPFSRNRHSAVHSHSILNAGFVLEGNLSTEGDLRIDGTVTGNIICKKRLVIGEHALVQGDIVCSSLDIAGKVNGNVKAKKDLHLRQTATLKGNVIAANFVVEPQANFTGNCQLLPAGEFTFELPQHTPYINETPQNHTGSAKPSAPARK
jgi:cytoskeletal protein CcmA (bactofilin family)